MNERIMKAATKFLEHVDMDVVEANEDYILAIEADDMRIILLFDNWDDHDPSYLREQGEKIMLSIDPEAFVENSFIKVDTLSFNIIGDDRALVRYYRDAINL